MIPALHRRRVLLVSDSSDEREMYAEWLRREGSCTLEAGNAADAYRMAVELEPQVIVTDVRLGGEDGLTLTRRLKENSRTKDVAVVILSGCTFTTDDDAAWRAGCDLVLHKPCLPDALAHAIDELKPSPRS